MSLLNNFISEIKLKFSKELRNIPEKEGLDALIYGIECNRIKLGDKSIGILSLSDKTSMELCFIDRTRDKINNIKIKYISEITFNKTSENLKNYKSDITNNENKMRFMQININKKTYDFEFYREKDLFLFIKGLILYLKSDNLLNEFNKEDGDYVEDNIEILFENNDENFNNLLEEKEFQNLAKEIGVDAKELLLYMDKNKDGIITKEEVINYFKDILKDLELKEVFEKYGTIKNKNDDIYTMNPDELKLFFHKEQKELINDLEAHQLIILFKSTIDKDIKRKICKKFQNIFFYNNYKMDNNKIIYYMENLNKKLKINKQIIEDISLELNLKEFSNMLNSFLLSIYDNNKQNSELDTSHCLIDYYINSSHNTYLKGHQLKGLSDPKMYSFAVLDGYRLVELDCYNGDNDDIIITHGFTLVTKLKLEDVLIELRENSFKNSPYPIILSIENHLDEKHQQILAKSLQKYLIDLYIFPTEIPPEALPSLEELKYKFIVKCGGKRLYENIDIPMKTIDEEKIKLRSKKNNRKKIIIEDNFEDVSDSEEDIETENIDEFDFNKNENNICVDRNNLLNSKNKISDDNRKSDLYIKDLEIINEEIHICEKSENNINEDKRDDNKILLKSKPNNKELQIEENDKIHDDKKDNINEVKNDDIINKTDNSDISKTLKSKYTEKPENEIIITHGYTLVSKLKLEDVLIELRENAFKNSPYPVILSIENHLDEKHQQIMAKNLKEYFNQKT